MKYVKRIGIYGVAKYHGRDGKWVSNINNASIFPTKSIDNGEYLPVCNRCKECPLRNSEGYIKDIHAASVCDILTRSCKLFDIGLEKIRHSVNFTEDDFILDIRKGSFLNKAKFKIYTIFKINRYCSNNGIANVFFSKFNKVNIWREE